MSEQKTRQFINGVWIEQKTFDNGNTILKLSVLPDKFIESLKSAAKNEKGYIKLVISERREVGKNNESHTMYVDDWKPTQGNKPQPASKPVAKSPVKPATKKVVEQQEEEELL